MRFGRLALLVALALPALAACGFKPVYGTMESAADGSAASAASAQLATVAIDPIPERNGQVLRNLLIDRMYREGRPGNPAWRLRTTLAVGKEDLGIQRDATATRKRLRLIANFELIDTKTNQVVYRSFSRSIVSFNVLQEQYGTLVAEQDAYDRGLNELAEDIRTRLALYFARDAR